MNHLLLSLVLLSSSVTSEKLAEDFNIPTGWRMQEAVAAADELACFGWVQSTSGNTVAGEGRCSKATGSRMLDQLRDGPGACVVDTFDAKDYEDTKIKLHFSHFKILDEARKTCFRDPPHQCPEFVTITSKTEQQACAQDATGNTACFHELS